MKRHSRAIPCPVCGGFDSMPRGQGRRCSGFTSDDGDFAHCSREELAGPLEQEDGGTFAHKMRGACRCGVTHLETTPSRSVIEKTYDYRDESGSLLFQVVRFSPKSFKQRRPDGGGGWVWKLEGVRRVLYRLPELLAADSAIPRYIVEGEKDVECLARHGHVATCNPGGASKPGQVPKWNLVADCARASLAGRDVVVVADTDAPGRAHARAIESSLRGVARSVRVTECSRGKDVSDLYAMGGQVPEDLVPLQDTPASETTKEHAPGAAESRPAISMTADLADVVDQAVAALAGDESLFQRDGRLVHVVRVAEAEADELSLAGTPQIRTMLPATLCERLSRVARFQRLDRRSNEWVNVLPAPQVVQAVLARGEYPAVRPLVGIIEAPSMRPDGSVLQAPGYDRTTGYLYVPTCAFPAVPDRPTQDDARRALVELEEPFADFPFAAPEHKASAIAAILTIVARPAIRGSVPAFLHDANTRGTGKTLNVDAVGTIATGRPSAKMQYPTDDVELEKILASYAIRGAALINFDNVTRLFGGGPLDRCLTAGDMVELRVLGKSEVPALRWRAVVMATGNNITLGGDTSRRVLVSRLESPLENPEERQRFAHHPLLDWVREERPRLVVAALTILRAWHVAGRPRGPCRSWGSFEAWSAMVPTAIVFAGGTDPMMARPAASGEEDAEKRALMSLIDGLARVAPGEGVTAKGLLDVLYPHGRSTAPPDGYDDLREAIETMTNSPPGKTPSSQRLGKALQRFRRRVVGGRMLDRRLDRHTEVARWVVVAGNAGIAGMTSLPRAESGRDNKDNRTDAAWNITGNGGIAGSDSLGDIVEMGVGS